MYSDKDLYTYTLLSLYILTPPTILSLIFLTAPYGKHTRPGWGPTLPPSLAWFLMESPSLFLTLLLFPYGKNHQNPRAAFLISPFLIHYSHRTLIYPLRIKPTSGKSDFPATVAGLGFLFNVMNSYLQTRWVSEYADLEGDKWFWWRFGIGVVGFGFGMWVNIWADGLLLGLRKMGGGYKVGRGGLFEFVSCPNYFGEILEWGSWAFICWSWAGFGFFVYTCANLVPRGVANHRWYLEKFGEGYPKGRKAVIPFLL